MVDTIFTCLYCELVKQTLWHVRGSQQTSSGYNLKIWNKFKKTEDKNKKSFRIGLRMKL